MDNTITNRAADNIRILSAAMVEKAKSGHPGGAMGGADFINILYSEFLNYDPDKLDYPFRDRFFLDPGHMSSHWPASCLPKSCSTSASGEAIPPDTRRQTSHTR